MANESVGKISLDLELQGDLNDQISAAASKIGEQLKSSMEKLNFKGMAESISKTINTSIENSMKAMQATIEKTVKAALSGAKGIKVPVNYDIPKNSALPNRNNPSGIAQPRAPPIPKINTGINMEALKSQIDNLTKSIDITNAKIELQKDKLAQLKEAYNMAFDGAKKNKLQEQILQTEAKINSLTTTSDKAGFKLADLDEQFNLLSSGAKQANAGVAALDNGIKNTANAASKGSSNFKSLNNSVKESGKSFSNSHNSMKMFFGTMVKWGIVFPIISRGIFAVAGALGNAFMANNQFATSLIQIKTNLEVAFMPIYQAVLPAVNALMSALSAGTAYIAAFVNALFGKTYQASFGAAKNLNTAVASMQAMEKQSKKTADAAAGIGTSAKKAAKEAKGSLAGFDEINQLQMNKDTGSGTAAMPAMIAPSIDLSPTSAAMGKISNLANGFKKVLATLFAPFKAAWAKDGAGVTAEFSKALAGTQAIFSNFVNMLSTPAVQNFIQSVVSLGLTVGRLFLFVYNNYFLPLLNWLISNTPVVAGILTPVINGVTSFINWLMGSGKPVLDIIVVVLGSLTAAFILVNGVISIATGVMSVFGAVMAFVTSPIGLVVLAIAAVIAIGVLLYKHWDTVKAVAANVWSGIQNIFQNFSNWLGSVFTTDWSKRFGIFGEYLNALLSNVKNIFNGVKSVFSGIIDFISGVFTGNWSKALNGMKEILRGVAGTFVGIMKAPLNGVIGLINGAISGLNRIKVPDWVPGVGGEGVNIPKIPYLASGGIIQQPTLAMVGEAGKEAVMPLENNTGWIDDLAGRVASKIGGVGNTEILDILKQILRAITERDGDLIIKIGESEFARIAINSINRFQRQAGRTLIEI